MLRAVTSPNNHHSESHDSEAYHGLPHHSFDLLISSYSGLCSHVAPWKLKGLKLPDWPLLSNNSILSPNGFLNFWRKTWVSWGSGPFLVDPKRNHHEAPTDMQAMINNHVLPARGPCSSPNTNFTSQTRSGERNIEIRQAQEGGFDRSKSWFIQVAASLEWSSR